MFESMVENLDIELEPEVIVIIPKILACFGNLEYEIEKVELIEPQKYKFKKKKKPKIKIL